MFVWKSQMSNWEVKYPSLTLAPMQTLSLLKSPLDPSNGSICPNLERCIALLSMRMSEVTTWCLGIYHGSQVSTVDFPLHVLQGFRTVQILVILLVPQNNHEACKTMIFTPILYTGQR